jgi:coenzyme PQQ synthesis protein D (PqqD)
MTDTQYVARSSKVAARMVGDEMMIMSGRDSTLFALNPTAAVIWEAADGVTPLKDIVNQHICVQFDVEPAIALSDAREVVEQLAGHGLLTLSDSPIKES